MLQHFFLAQLNQVAIGNNPCWSHQSGGWEAPWALGMFNYIMLTTVAEYSLSELLRPSPVE